MGSRREKGVFFRCTRLMCIFISSIHQISGNAGLCNNSSTISSKQTLTTSSASESSQGSSETVIPSIHSHSGADALAQNTPDDIMDSYSDLPGTTFRGTLDERHGSSAIRGSLPTDSLAPSKPRWKFSLVTRARPSCLQFEECWVLPDKLAIDGFR